MATNRFQFSDDFVLNNGNVGINTASPQEKLDVVGTVKADNLKVTGISSFTAYDGFLNNNQNITDNVTLSSGTSGSLSGEIVVGIGFTVTVGSAATSSQGNIDSLKVYNNFTVPTGGTEDRPRKVKPGQLYYNNDFKTVEFWDGNVWKQVDNTTTSGRGVFGSGVTPTTVNTIDFITIASLGNALDFGDLTQARFYANACSSSTRGVFGGGYTVNTIDFITIASTGNAIDFGDLTVARYGPGACSSSTRGVFGGGNPITNTIDYITISSTGNALDFGDLTQAIRFPGACSSSTRGVFGGGYAPALVSRIDFITIASLGNATNFGNLTQVITKTVACSSSTRGVFGSGSTPTATNTIDYITISTSGNATDFGDLTQARNDSSACSSSTRGVFGGGYVAPLKVNTIDFITISTTGNAVDLGDLTETRSAHTGLSDCHGGLGGF